MDEKLPIEEHFGAMALIEDCWRCEGSSDDWKRAVNQLHGASMTGGECIRQDLWFLVDIGYKRLEMAREAPL